MLLLYSLRLSHPTTPSGRPPPRQAPLDSWHTARLMGSSLNRAGFGGILYAARPRRKDSRIFRPADGAEDDQLAHLSELLVALREEIRSRPERPRGRPKDSLALESLETMQKHRAVLLPKDVHAHLDNEIGPDAENVA